MLIRFLIDTPSTENYIKINQLNLWVRKMKKKENWDSIQLIVFNKYHLRKWKIQYIVLIPHLNVMWNKTILSNSMLKSNYLDLKAAIKYKLKLFKINTGSINILPWKVS